MPAVIMGAFVAADAKVFNLLLGHVYIFFWRLLPAFCSLPEALPLSIRATMCHQQKFVWISKKRRVVLFFQHIVIVVALVAMRNAFGLDWTQIWSKATGDNATMGNNSWM
jgi:hypothetical protein